MNGQSHSKDGLLSLSARRFEAVGSRDLEATMAMLVEKPVFELFPVGLRLSGQANVRRYYECFFATGEALGGEVIDMFVSDDAVCMELKMRYAGVHGEEWSRMIAIQPVEGDRFTGERLYGDERLFRQMFSEPIWSLLQPLEA